MNHVEDRVATQEQLSRYGKPIQDIARFSSSQGYGIGLRNFALFLLYREDWERMFTFPGAPESFTGTIQVSIQQYELLTKAAFKAMGFHELAPFLLGKRPSNLSLKSSYNRGSYVLAVQDNRALAICPTQLLRQPGSMITSIGRILRNVAPAIEKVTLLAVNATGELELSNESLNHAVSLKTLAN